MVSCIDWDHVIFSRTTSICLFLPYLDGSWCKSEICNTWVVSFFSTPLLVNQALQDPMLPGPQGHDSTIISQLNSYSWDGLWHVQCKALR
jgi:hypothetical protein